MRAVAVALVFVALAGCGRPMDLGGGPQGECFFGGAEARWTQPSLYDDLPVAAARAGLALDAVEGGAGARVEHRALARWRDPTIVEVSRTVDDSTASMRLSASLPGEWRLEAGVTWDNETLARHAIAFLEEIGLAGHPERAAWLHAMNASRQHGPYPVSLIIAEPDLAALLDRLGEANVTEGDLGNARFQWDRWIVAVNVGVHVLRIVDPARFDLIVDERGSARASTPLQPSENATEVFHERAKRVYERLGLAQPEFGRIRGGYGAC